jgi:mannose-1-phosphate guanylyltransferase
MQNNYVAIMAGGIGSRFWPASRSSYPKQFLDILGTGRTLIQWTYHRFSNICPKENIYFITNQQYVETLKAQIPDLDDAHILSEPFRKNTAPAMALMAYKVHEINPKANIIMAPSDHLIMDERAFERTVFDALDFTAHHDVLLTLGIQPTRPDTGYGYIQYEVDQDDEFNRAYKVKTFTEKPNLELAKTFIRSGDFLWNSGIFVWNAKTIIDAFKAFLPEVHELFSNDIKGICDNNPAVLSKIYSQAPNISIDYGIMEKASNVHVIPASFGWSDLGTWESAYDNSEKDYLGNAVYGDNVMVIDASECMISVPNDKLVVVQGIENCIVIDTKDVLLICERDKEQQIKEYVAEVKRNKGDKFL